MRRFSRKGRDELQAMGSARPISEQPTRPMDAILLARALQGEGRRHASLAMASMGDRKAAKGRACAYSLVGNYDGQLALPDFAVLGVADDHSPDQRVPNGQIALATFFEKFTGTILVDLLSPDSLEEYKSLQNGVMEAYQAAERVVRKIDPASELSMTAAMILADVMILAHAGTARAYHIDHHHIERIGFDAWRQPEAVRSRIEDGVGMAEAPEGDGKGASSSDPIAVISRPVARDGYLLICTEMFWKEVGESVIYQIVSSAEGVHESCHRLVARASAVANIDDAAIALIHFPPDFGSWI